MSDAKNDLPPPPERPDPDECCGAGCNPCILDTYEDELARWRQLVEERESMREASREDEKRPDT